MLTSYVTNLIPKLVVDATSLMPWFYLSTGWRSSSPRMQRKTGYTPLQWLRCDVWMATKRARSSSAWLPCVGSLGCHAESLSQAGHVSHQQSKSVAQDRRWSGMTFLRNLWQGLFRTFVSDCKHACSRLADTLNIQCDWIYVNLPPSPFS